MENEVIHSGSKLVIVYAAYALFAVSLTVYLARTLFQNGAIFLRDVFKDQVDLAGAVNRLLVIGFYLFNLGYAALIMRAPPAVTAVQAIEVLAEKLGMLLLSLGAAHFFNMYLLYRIRRRSTALQMDPPVLPQMNLGSQQARAQSYAQAQG